jgi:predicted nuclease of predicted toxin-antitoxin system
MSKFKIDENLPVDVADLLVVAGFDALTVIDQELGGKSDDVIADCCRTEARALITMDLGFANIRAFPPADYSGLIVLRLSRPDRNHILAAITRLIPLLRADELADRLWIVEEAGVRIHG